MAAFDEQLALRHTNVSTPHLEHSESKRSIIAEEYFSAQNSSRGSSPRPVSGGSGRGLVAESVENIFSTPPASPTFDLSHGHWPLAPSSSSPLQHARSAEVQPLFQPRTSESPNADRSIRVVSNSSIRRKPVGSGSRRVSSQMDTDPGPPTPDADNTPYIRFAIDQLTRDEEVRGTRRYAYPSGDLGVLRVTNPTESESDSATPPEKQTSQDDKELPETVAAAAATGVATGVVASEIREKTSSPKSIESRSTPQEYSEAREHLQAEPTENPRTSSRYSEVPTTQQPDVFVPVDQETSDTRLRFLPGILRPVELIAYAFLLLLLLVALGFSGGWSNSHQGLWDYKAFGDARYFLFQYVPTICAVILQLWLFQIQVALQRLAPFIAMSSTSLIARKQGPLMQTVPNNFLMPQLFYFRSGLPVIGICMFLFWLQIFNVPLMACVFNVNYYGAHGSGMWRWSTTQGTTWAVFGLYALQLLAVLSLFGYLHIIRVRTGLLYDFRSLSDVISILAQSNVTQAYNKSELFATAKQFRRRLAGRDDRLGYWKPSSRPTSTFYALGEEGGETRRYSLERGRITEKPLDDPQRNSFPETSGPLNDEEREDLISLADLEHNDQLSKVRYRYIPGYLRTLPLLLLSAVAILLFGGFIAVSFINNKVINGFVPMTNVFPTASGFSATNFLYSFIPALIGQLLFLAWLSVDYAFRRLQPFANMSASSRGAFADRSLLLDYPARLPISVTIAALRYRDMHVAWFSMVSLIASAIPILAGGCFWAQFYVPQQQIRVAVQPPAYYALCVFVGLYALSLPLCFIGLRRRRLPHKVTTLSELISFFYASGLLREQGWRRGPARSKRDVSSRLLHGRDSGESRFGFGRFIASDGTVHLGVHRVLDDDSAEEYYRTSDKMRTPAAARHARAGIKPERRLTAGQNYAAKGGVPAFTPPGSRKYPRADHTAPPSVPTATAADGITSSQQQPLLEGQRHGLAYAKLAPVQGVTSTTDSQSAQQQSNRPSVQWQQQQSRSPNPRASRNRPKHSNTATNTTRGSALSWSIADPAPQYQQPRGERVMIRTSSDDEDVPAREHDSARIEGQEYV